MGLIMGAIGCIVITIQHAHILAMLLLGIQLASIDQWFIACANLPHTHIINPLPTTRRTRNQV